MLRTSPHPNDGGYLISMIAARRSHFTGSERRAILMADKDFGLQSDLLCFACSWCETKLLS